MSKSLNLFFCIFSLIIIVLFVNFGLPNLKNKYVLESNRSVVLSNCSSVNRRIDGLFEILNSGTIDEKGLEILTQELILIGEDGEGLKLKLEYLTLTKDFKIQVFEYIESVDEFVSLMWDTIDAIKEGSDTEMRLITMKQIIQELNYKVESLNKN